MAGKSGKQTFIGPLYHLSLGVFRKVTVQSWSVRTTTVGRSGVEEDFNKLHLYGGQVGTGQ